jgi:hypothetical protein
MKSLESGSTAFQKQYICLFITADESIFLNVKPRSRLITAKARQNVIFHETDKTKSNQIFFYLNSG